MLVLTLPSTLPPHATWPVSWRYCSLPRSVGRRRTLGDLYAISWRQGAYPRRFLCIRCLTPSPCICMSSLLWDCPCLLHVKKKKKKNGLVNRVCTSMQDGEERAQGMCQPWSSEVSQFSQVSEVFCDGDWAALLLLPDLVESQEKANQPDKARLVVSTSHL